MARGRIIVSDITKDKRVNDLSDDTSRLAFTWLVTFADREGRTHGDPAIVRSMVFPRRDDISVDRMRGYIAEWATCGLVEWYEAEGDQWVAFPSFAKHQTGFDQRHEPKSVIPEPPQTMPDRDTENVRTSHVQCTAEGKRIEEKGREENHPRAREKIDPVAHMLTARAEMQAGIADPTQDAERWMQYRDDALKVYQQASGLKLAPANHDAIVALAGEPDFILARWQKSIGSCIGGGVKPSNVDCMIDTYRDGGDYKAMLDKRKPKGRTNGRRPVQPGTEEPSAEDLAAIRAINAEEMRKARAANR